MEFIQLDPKDIAYRAELARRHRLKEGEVVDVQENPQWGSPEILFGIIKMSLKNVTDTRRADFAGRCKDILLASFVECIETLSPALRTKIEGCRQQVQQQVGGEAEIIWLKEDAQEDLEAIKRTLKAGEDVVLWTNKAGTIERVLRLESQHGTGQETAQLTAEASSYTGDSYERDLFQMNGNRVVKFYRVTEKVRAEQREERKRKEALLMALTEGSNRELLQDFVTWLMNDVLKGTCGQGLQRCVANTISPPTGKHVQITKIRQHGDSQIILSAWRHDESGRRIQLKSGIDHPPGLLIARTLNGESFEAIGKASIA